MSENIDKKLEHVVLVTGFAANLNAPYGNASSNSSGLVARILPGTLNADDPLNASRQEIRILDSVKGDFDGIPAELGAVRRRIQELHAEHGDTVRLWVHLGRAPWEFVTCERRAFRQDFSSSWFEEEQQQGYYLGRDNVGQNVRDLGPCPWMQVPIGLHSEVDIDAVVAGANQMLEGRRDDQLKVVSHIEAGSSGCGFTYYESMASCFSAGRRRDVLFCHVPRDEDPAALEKAKNAILAIIGASIDTLSSRDEIQPSEDPIFKFGSWR